jgi:uncharacterized protein YegL
MTTTLNPEFVNGDPRVACLLLLDTSGSMGAQVQGLHGTPIEALNQGLKAFELDIQEDPLARRRVDIAIVTFGQGVHTVQEFGSAAGFVAPALSAAGLTPMGEAITLAVQKVKARSAQYRANGVPRYRPWIFMITDGAPTDEWQSAAALVRQEEDAKSFAFFGVGVQNADMDVLRAVTDRVIRLDGLKFRDLFLWLSTSQKRVSASKEGEQTPLPAVTSFTSPL